MGQPDSVDNAPSRRRFLSGVGRVTAALTVLPADIVRGATRNSQIAIGVIGCGSRGRFIANLLTRHGGYAIPSVCDPFSDRADAVGEKHGVPSGQRFSGLSGYKRLLEQKLDAVAIESPSYRDVGDCFDTFSVTYRYADDVGVAFSSRQFEGHGTRPEGIRTRFFGSRGVFESQYGGQVLIRGSQAYAGGETPGIYEQGAVANLSTFHDAISRSDFSNPTVAESVRSNLVAILGRTAAYTRRPVTWDALLKSDERLVPDLSGLKD